MMLFICVMPVLAAIRISVLFGGESMKQSSVWFTMPSVEFSTGTTP